MNSNVLWEIKDYKELKLTNKEIETFLKEYNSFWEYFNK
jgi:hypothetical protein